MLTDSDEIHFGRFVITAVLKDDVFVIQDREYSNSLQYCFAIITRHPNIICRVNKLYQRWLT